MNNVFSIMNFCFVLLFVVNVYVTIMCNFSGDTPPPPHNVERFECLEKAEKRYINVMNNNNE